MDIEIINGIGDSMKYWANYMVAVKRDKIINESAIKFAISEYLVASENMDPERKKIKPSEIKSVKFEEGHEVFKKRRVDLCFDVLESESEKRIYFEFKYLRSMPLDTGEINRYIDDLFRLAALAKNNNNLECFFMLVGFPEHLKNILNINSGRNNIDYTSSTSKTYNEIIESLPSDEKECKKVILKNLYYSESNSTHLKRFSEDYIYRCNIDEKSKLNENDIMKISLLYGNPSTDNEKIGVYIWQIELYGSVN